MTRFIVTWLIIISVLLVSENSYAGGCASKTPGTESAEKPSFSFGDVKGSVEDGSEYLKAEGKAIGDQAKGKAVSALKNQFSGVQNIQAITELKQKVDEFKQGLASSKMLQKLKDMGGVQSLKMKEMVGGKFDMSKMLGSVKQKAVEQGQKRFKSMGQKYANQVNSSGEKKGDDAKKSSEFIKEFNGCS